MSDLSRAIHAVIEGSKGGESQRKAVEAPDSLFSIANARIIDFLSEGEIEGFVHGADFLRDVYFDETPVQNEDGTKNFKNFQVDARTGTQDQTYIPGFPAVESELGVNVALKYGVAWTRSFTNKQLSAVRVRIGTPAMSAADTTTGDVKGTSVQYAMDIATDGGAFVEVLRSAMTGKASSTYERGHRLELPTSTVSGWIVRVRRLTPDSTTQYLANDTSVVSVTEIIDGKFRYPMSALVGVQIDASQFQSIPTRAYHLKGRKIRVPANYDPVTRTYATSGTGTSGGAWNGTFKTVYSNNPAWVFYDMTTHKRYGLGRLVDELVIDKWSLYAIGQYCDETVPDGFGGTEPRMTCNLYLQKAADAWKVMGDLTSIFRGICYWAGGSIVPVADRPADPVYTYTNANVTGGSFKYESTSRRARHTAVIVSYNDLSDFGRLKSDYYDDPEGIARFGFQLVEINALGCTSRGQAQRFAKWLLYSEKLLTNTVAFGVSLEGTFAAPGQIVRVADKHRAGRRIGGRIASATASGVVLDALPTPAPMVGDTLIVTLPSGVTESRSVSSIVGNGVNVSVPFSSIPVKESIWAIESTDLSTQLFRVLSTEKGDDGGYSMLAMQHNPSIFDAVDFGEPITVAPISVIPSPVQARPATLTITSVERAGNVVAMPLLTAKWAKSPGAVKYTIQWRKDSGEWTTPQEVHGTTADYQTPFSGFYEAKVQAISSLGVVSVPKYSDPYELVDQALKPGFVEGLEADITDALTTAQNAQATADGAIISFWQTSAPVIGSGAGQAKVGDIWFDTDDGNSIWRVVGGVWVNADNDELALALAAAADAQSTADGKVKTYFQSTAPTGSALRLGDLWFNTTTKKLFRWSGTAWDQNIADITLDQIAGSGVNILWDEYSQPNSQTPYLVSCSGGSSAYYDPAQSVGSANGSLKVAVTDDTNGAYVALGTSLTDYNLPLEPGKKYIVSASFRAGNSGASFVAKIKNSNGTYYNAAEGNKNIGTANVWTRLSWVINADQNLYGNGILLLYTNRSEVTADYNVWIDRIMVEEQKGNLAFPSAWQPGPAGRIALTAIANAASAQATADGKINSFFQDAAPAIGSGAGQAQVGDIWFDTNDGNKIYTVVGSVWVATPDSRIAQAIADAAGAQATADGKVKTFYQDSAPTATGVGDLWYNDSSMELKRWSGSSWDGADNGTIGDGPNLLPNSTFAYNSLGLPNLAAPPSGRPMIDGWLSWVQPSAAGADAAASVDGGYIRLRELGSTALANGASRYTQVKSARRVSVKEGKTYRISIHSSQSYNGSLPAGLTAQFRVWLGWYDSTGTLISAPTAMALIRTSTSGGDNYATAVAPAGASTCYFYFGLYFSNGTGASWTHNSSVAWQFNVFSVGLTQVNDLEVAGSTQRIGDQRNLPGSLTSAFGVTNTTTALSASSSGAISVLAHTKRYGAASVSYSAVSNAVTGKAVGSTWVIYCIDPDYSGGVQTWLAGGESIVGVAIDAEDRVRVAVRVSDHPPSLSSAGSGHCTVQSVRRRPPATRRRP